MKDLEKVYDEEIFPLMGKVLEVCMKHDLPMFADFQLSDDVFCRSCHKNEKTHPLITELQALSQCLDGPGVNVDKYIMWLMKNAKKNGHSSMLLGQLGVSVKPVA